MTDKKTINLLAAKMLRLARDTFRNKTCHDLDDEVVALIPQSLCDEIRQRNSNGRDELPKSPAQIGDSTLMDYLADALENEAQ